MIGMRKNTLEAKQSTTKRALSYTDGIVRVKAVVAHMKATHSDKIDLVDRGTPSQVPMQAIHINENASVFNMHFTPSLTQTARVRDTICFLT